VNVVLAVYVNVMIFWLGFSDRGENGKSLHVFI